jgi:hypothetical protein
MIKDNFLEAYDFKPIQDVLLGPNIPWYLTENMTWHDVESTDYHFTHVFYANNTWVSDHARVLEPLLRDLDVNAIIRIKANLYPRGKEIIEHAPHTDYDFEHKAAIFCINDCNGYTMLGDELVNSRENRLIMHDASKLHQSTNCTDAKFRVNIVLNYF